MGNIQRCRVLRPQFYDKFRCIGTDCEDTCCKNWLITIDKSTYKEYRKVKDPDFRRKLDTYVKRLHGEQTSDALYAKFVLNEENYCPFQNENMLCDIQLKLGEKALCTTCQTYPRQKTLMRKDILQLSLTMSCPEVVRKALFSEQPIIFDLDLLDIDDSSELYRMGVITPVQGEQPTAYLEYSWPMLEACIDIMQDRQYSLANRIVIIGMMLRRITQLHEEGQAPEIPGALEMFRIGCAGGQFAQEFDGIETNILLQQSVNQFIYGVFFDNYYPKNQQKTEFTALYSRFMQNQPGLDPPDNVEAFVKALISFDAYVKSFTAAHWDDFLASYSHVLENYLVNFMFSEIFPLKFHDKGLDPYHHSLILAEQYALLKILLCCGWQEDEGFSQAYITKAITAVARMNQHSQDPLTLVKRYKETELNSLPYLYHLVM